MPEWVHDGWTLKLPEELRTPYFLAREVVYRVGDIGLHPPVVMVIDDAVEYEPNKKAWAEDILRLRGCVDELKLSLGKEIWRFNAVNEKPLTLKIPWWAVPLVEANAHALVAEIGRCASWEFIRTILKLEYPDSWTHEHSITTQMVTKHFDRLSKCFMSLGGVDTYDTLYRMLDQEIAKVYSRFGNDFPLQPSNTTDSKPAEEPAASKTRPAYERDHKWLDWHEQDKQGSAHIRDRWDALPEEQRISICRTAFDKVGGNDAAEKKAGYEVVKTALTKARRERGK